MSARRSEGPRTAGIISLGCPKNLVDTEYLMGALRDRGWSFTGDARGADLLVVNTCAFLDDAVAESREAVAEALAAKEAAGGGMRVVVAGCLVSRCGSRLRREHPGVDLFLKPGGIPRLAGWLDAAAPRPMPLNGANGFCPAAPLPRAVTTGPFAYLKISDGCDNRCSYCLIPAIRGRHRSRRARAILDEARRLVAGGVRELLLVGQDITRWQGERPEMTLSWLVRSLTALPGDFRVRLLYLHPARLGTDLIDLLAEEPRLCPYVDLPIQHADDRVLKAMNRPSTRKELGRLVERIRRRVPGVALRTTVMVGHPREGKREFASLLRFIADHPFDHLGAFVFSPQPGTPSAEQAERVDGERARERHHEVMSMQAGISRRLLAGRRGITARALVLRPDPRKPGRHVALSPWQAPDIDGCLTVSGEAAPGEFATVRITGSGTYDLRGKVRFQRA